MLLIPMLFAFIICVVLFFLVLKALSGWIFRLDEQIALQREILQALKKLDK